VQFSAKTIAVGQDITITIKGGKAPYSVTSANTKIAGVTGSGNTYQVKGASAGAVKIDVKDSAGNHVSQPITVTAQSTGTFASKYDVTGTWTDGKGNPYHFRQHNKDVEFDLNVSDLTHHYSGTYFAQDKFKGIVTRKTLSTGCVTRNEVTYTVISNNEMKEDQIRLDSNCGHTAGSKATQTLTRTATPPPPPAAKLDVQFSAASVEVGKSASIAIKGGKAPYSVTSANTKIADVTGSGSAYQVKGASAGAVKIDVKDSAGDHVSQSITVTMPSPVKTDVKFNNYNSGVACSYTDKATFTLKEPIRQAQAALWYDFGNVTQNVSYTLMASGKKIGSGTVKKGDCAAGHTWCHGFIELGDLTAGTYTMVASPGRVCHNVNHDGGNGFVMISGTPKK
jgi:hypothetical protein